MTTRASIDAFLSGKRLALVGASRTQKKFGNVILRELRKKDYTVRVVHPHAERIEGEACVGSLAALSGEVDRVLVVTAPGAVPALLREAAEAKMRRVWLQQGAESEEALRMGAELGLDVIADQCILMHAEPRGPHAAHRFIVKLFGRLPK